MPLVLFVHIRTSTVTFGRLRMLTKNLNYFKFFLFSIFYLFFYIFHRDAFRNADYVICLKIYRCTPRLLWLQRFESRVSVAVSLEWWTCAQATRAQSPSADCYFLLNSVSFSDFFEIIDFNCFRFHFIKNHNNNALFSKNMPFEILKEG